MTSEDDQFKQQMEMQRLAFEQQFGSLESMGFEDKTKLSSDSEQQTTSSSDEDSQEENGSDRGGVSSSDEVECDDDDEDEEKQDENKIEQKRSYKSQPKVTKPQPKIIKFDFSQNDVSTPTITKEERKLLKSGKSTIVKPNKALQSNNSRKPQNKNDEDDNDDDNDDDEADNLQKDIELQNFIKDSHLLASFDPSNSSTSTHGTTIAHGDDMFGKVRMKALEQRFQNMKNSHSNVSAKKKQLQLESVPMNIRKGMLNKHMERIAKHENFAKENGIVLSKVAKGKFRKIDFTYKKDIERRIGDSIKSKEKNFQKTMHRDKGLKINSVGRSTRNGLVISQKDIKRINGEGMSSGGKRGGRGGKKSFGKRR